MSDLPLLLLFFLLVYPAFCCRSLHAKSHGVEVACCSETSPLPTSCEYSALCADSCSCRLVLSSSLHCEESGNSVLEWRDHASSLGTLRCDRPTLPNKEAPYYLIIQGWNNRTYPFLKGLCGTHLTKLIMEIGRGNVSFPQFYNCFPSVESVDISTGQRIPLDLEKMLAFLKSLKSLRTVGFDFQLPSTTPAWAPGVEYVHIENSSLFELPKWLSLAENLTTIVVKHTFLSSISIVAQLKNLRSARLSHNKINDLHRHLLSTPEIYDLDLSHNQITSLATFTFSQCPELRVLDLSDNPIAHLPFRPFLRNSRLKWLKLTDTKITTLTADHFVGLSSLRTLSLSRNALHSVAPYSFLPLKGLRSLDLQSCNLTKVPSAVTQNCALTHLNLADNLFHRSNSLPPEVLSLLSTLSQLRIENNPLTEFPPSLLLLSTENVKLYRQLVSTTTQLPMWTSEPCTPFFWNMHLRNRSRSLRQLVSAWNEPRMLREGLAHCREQFEWMSDQMTIYRDLERSSGCSVSRRLRSAIQHVSSSCNTTSSTSTPLPSVSTEPVPVPSQVTPLLLISLAINIFFLVLIATFVCIIWNCGKEPKY